MTSSVRTTASKVLSIVSHGKGRRFASEVIDEIDKTEKLGARDRRFLTEIVLGVLRHRRTIDTIIRAYSRVPGEELDERVLDALRLAVYQLIFLDGIPPHAAVSESVKLVRRRPHHRAFVNGLLRTLVRELKKVDPGEDRGGTSLQRRLEIEQRRVCFFPRNVFADPSKDKLQYLGQVHSYPNWLVRRWLDRYGEGAARTLFEESNRRPRTYLRVNPTKTTCEEAAEGLRREGVPVAEGPGPLCLVVSGPLRVLLRSRAMSRGLVSVQGAAAQRVVPALQPEPGQRLLEIGAAPGAKTAQMAEMVEGRATIVALDRDRARLGRVAEGVRRLGLAGVRLVAADGADLPVHGGVTFDGILVDAPCSNTAVLSRRPEARWRLSDEALAGLRAIQETLLRSASRHLCPGGKLVYSTCSLEPEENEILVRGVLQGTDGLEIVSEQTQLPGSDVSDGGYYCQLTIRPGDRA